MSCPNQYYGKGSHMSFDLKQVIKRVRKSRPDMFTAKRIERSSMDAEGKVTVTAINDVKAHAPTPAQRHRFSIERRRF